MTEEKNRLERLLEEQLAVQPSACPVPEYDTVDELRGIRAITYENVPYEGKRTKVFAYIGLPEQATEEHRVPAMVLLHGGGGHAYACWVKMWNDRGFAAIAMDTTGFMPCAPNAGSREGGGDEAKWERALRAPFDEVGFTVAPDNDALETAGVRPVEDQWIYHALCGAIRGHTILRSMPQVDETRVGVTGISWGGVITSLLIGYDPRLAFAVPVYGSGYLGEGLGEQCAHFRNPAVRQLWLAEDRFDKVRMPVLWLGWNDDTAFSVQSNTKSCQQTKSSHNKTRLVLHNQMFHSHQCGWRPPEIEAFARWIVANGEAFPQLQVTETDGQVTAFSTGASLEHMTLYYITAPMTYARFDKFGQGEKLYMEQVWQTVAFPASQVCTTVRLPENAAGYYVEAVFYHGKQPLVITGEYTEVSRQ